MLTEFELLRPKDCWWEVDFCWALKLWLLGLTWLADLRGEFEFVLGVVPRG